LRRPSIGKSAVVKLLAKKRGLPLRDVRALLLDPVDLRGLPYLRDGPLEMGDAGLPATRWRGVLFLDELNAAPPMKHLAKTVPFDLELLKER